MEAEGETVDPCAVCIIPFPGDVKQEWVLGGSFLVGNNPSWGPEGKVVVVGVRKGIHVLDVLELVELAAGERRGM